MFVRIEAIRTEQHQTRYQPLQPYQHEEGIKDRVRSWRQVLMFLARTHKRHDWASPKYRFTHAAASMGQRNRHVEISARHLLMGCTATIFFGTVHIRGRVHLRLRLRQLLITSNESRYAKHISSVCHVANVE